MRGAVRQEVLQRTVTAEIYSKLARAINTGRKLCPITNPAAHPTPIVTATATATAFTAFATTAPSRVEIYVWNLCLEHSVEQVCGRLHDPGQVGVMRCQGI
jgi:hypothetical protein